MRVLCCILFEQKCLNHTQSSNFWCDSLFTLRMCLCECVCLCMWKGTVYRRWTKIITNLHGVCLRWDCSIIFVVVKPFFIGIFLFTSIQITGHFRCYANSTFAAEQYCVGWFLCRVICKQSKRIIFFFHSNISHGRKWAKCAKHPPWPPEQTVRMCYFVATVYVRSINACPIDSFLTHHHMANQTNGTNDFEKETKEADEEWRRKKKTRARAPVCQTNRCRHERYDKAKYGLLVRYCCRRYTSFWANLSSREWTCDAMRCDVSSPIAKRNVFVVLCANNETRPTKCISIWMRGRCARCDKNCCLSKNYYYCDWPNAMTDAKKKQKKNLCESRFSFACATHTQTHTHNATVCVWVCLEVSWDGRNSRF